MKVRATFYVQYCVFYWYYNTLTPLHFSSSVIRNLVLSHSTPNMEQVSSHPSPPFSSWKPFPIVPAGHWHKYPSDSSLWTQDAFGIQKWASSLHSVDRPKLKFTLTKCRALIGWNNWYQSLAVSYLWINKVKMIILIGSNWFLWYQNCDPM